MTSLMQLESGSEQLDPESFDVAELLDNLLQKMRRHLPSGISSWSKTIPLR